jgi:hypothetical protein
MDTTQYTELKSLEDMPGSINNLVSDAHRFKRPYAFSESFANTPENIERAKRSSSANTTLLEIEEPVVAQPAETNEAFFTNILMRFVFHITLISIFESVFFFLYISKLEDNGIILTVGGIIDNIVDSCRNFTAEEDAVATDILSVFINTSDISNDANKQYAIRVGFNGRLFVRAWTYVGCLGGLFLLMVLYVNVRKIKIHWKNLLLENMGLVLMLAAYEYMFFSTIIFPYMPISGSEITQEAIQELQTTCGILRQ